MKKIKMKDTILSHYQKVHELEMDGITVRVFKPRTMQQLPAYRMLRWIKNRAEDAIDWMKIENTTYWGLGNPDLGMWDAQTVYHYDPRHKAFNIYFTALLVRPFSEQAYSYYNMLHENVDDVNQRLMLMWDSREFDRIGGYDQSYGTYENQDEADAVMYRVVNKESDIRDTSPSCYLQVIDNDEYSPVQRCGVTFRQMPDGGMEYHATINGREEMVRGGTELMHACAKVFCDFRKEHPEVTEMHFYTDELLDVQR
ncbi:MAG: hypothetical protein IKK92_02855 [Prevotella sp.]|nr:hypothetical protein [Prevotella sp.]